MNNAFDDDVSIAGFQMVDDTYCNRVIATMSLVVSGCRFDAFLSIGGSLRFSNGVRISAEVRERATEIAKQAAMAKLTHAWFGGPRASGTVHRIRAVEACEEATRG